MKNYIAAVIALSCVLMGGNARGQDTNTLELIKKLQERIDELEQKVKVLEAPKPSIESTNQAREKLRVEDLSQKVDTLTREREEDKKLATEKAKTTPTVSLGLNGLSVRSSDSNFVMYLHGYAQADGRFYLNDRGTANDTFLLRRVRPIIEGTVYNKFDYRVMTDFGSGNVSSSSAGNNALLDDAYVNARLWPQFQVQAGKFKSPVGLERLQSTAELLFVENGFATQFTPNYDVGVEIHNSFFTTPVGYAIGIFNGAADAASDDQEVNDESKDFVGRLFAQPFMNTGIEPLRKLGFGIGGSIGSHQGSLPSYKTAGQQTFFSYANGVTAGGRQYRLDPQAYYYWGPFGILGEYIISSPEVVSTNKLAPRARFHNRAWEVEASWFLTGDENSFRFISTKPFVPAHPFNPGAGDWGAVELVARVEQLSLDDKIFPRFASATSAKEETSWGVGLNWYLNSNVRFYLDYESTWFKGGSMAKSSASSKDEHIVFGRAQFSF